MIKIPQINNFMKQYFNHVLLLTIILIIISIILGFKNISSDQKYACSFNGKNISKDDFLQNYNNTKAKLRLQYGDSLDSMTDYLHIDQMVFNNLIIKEDAKQKNIKVTDQEVIEDIFKYKIFYKKNKFDVSYYRNILKQYLKTKVSDFENSIKDDLLYAKLLENITSNVSITEEELINEFKDKTQKITVSYLFFPFNTKEALFKYNVSKQEIQEYYNNNKNSLFIDDAIKIEYVFLKYPEDGGVQKQVETKFKAKAIYDEYQKSKDIKKAAKEFKFDYNINQSDFFTKKTLDKNIPLPPKYLIKAFRLKINQLQEPIETNAGYIVFKVKEHRRSYQPNIKAATNIIAARIRNQKLSDDKLKDVQTIFNNIKNKKPSDTNSFTEITKTMGLETTSLEPLLRSEMIILFNLNKDQKNKLLSLDIQNKLSDIIKSNTGFYILWLKDEEPLDLNKLASIKTDFKEMILKKKRQEIFEDYLKELKNKYNFSENSFLEY